jgi:hypothetical protein
MKRSTVLIWNKSLPPIATSKKMKKRSDEVGPLFSCRSQSPMAVAISSAMRLAASVGEGALVMALPITR